MSPNISLKILQWNCHSFHNKQGILSTIATQYDIILLCETWLTLDSIPKLDGFNILTESRLNHRGGGLAICIKKNIPFSQIHTIYHRPDFLETLSVSIPTPTGPLTIVCLYRSPSYTTMASEWRHLFNSLSAHANLLVAGDFNSHHTSWGCSEDKAPGPALSDALLDFNLICLNDGSATFENSHTSNINNTKISAIDLSIVSPHLAPLCSWQVESDTMLSDHYPISISLGLSFSPISFSSSRFPLNKIDWEQFATTLRSLAPSISDPDPLIQYGLIIDAIESAITSATANSPNRSHKKSIKSRQAIWWDRECQKANQDRKEAWAAFRRTTNLTNLIAAKKSDAIAKKTFKKAKKESWTNFTKSINFHSSSAQVWAKIKRFRHRNTSDPANSPANEATKTKLLDMIHSISPPSCFYPDFPTHFDSVAHLETPFTFNELTAAIKRSNFKSAPGRDKIDFTLISKLPDPILQLILTTFNDIFSKGLFPESWKEFLVLFIPKASPGKFRPISLASCLLKLMERMIHARMIQWLESEMFLSPTQFGFRKTRSCADNLAILTTEIYTGFAKNQFTAAIFLDVASAFDNVDPNILSHDLSAIGLPWRYCKFIYNLTSSREIFFKISGETHGPYTSHKGVPQGCILSPLLYILYTNHLDRKLHPQSHCLQFADDIAIFSRSNSLFNCTSSIQISVDNISAYLLGRGLTVEPTKSNLVIFSRKQMNPADTAITVKGTRVKGCSEAKFLGLTLDYRLSWKPHLESLLSKCKNLLNIIKCLRSTWWGADPSTLITIYRALIRSSIEYGSAAIPYKSNPLLAKFEVIQRRALRLALGLRNSTPNNVVLAEAKEPLLHFRLQSLSDKYILRVFSSSWHPLLTSLPFLRHDLQNRQSHRILLDLPLLQSYDRFFRYKRLIEEYPFPPTYMIPPSATVPTSTIDISAGRMLQESNNPENDFLTTFSEHLSESTSFYTDGSKKGDGLYVGFAIYSPSLDLSLKYRISSYASVFSAEALAILQTIKLIISNNICKSCIFSDSLSTLQAILSPSRTSPIVLEIAKHLVTASERELKINIIWIPGHSGIPGNEVADELAKSATSNGIEFPTTLPPSEFFNIASQKCISSTNRILILRSRQNKGKLYFENFHNDLQKPWFQKLGHLDRKITVTISRMRSNHYNLAASLFRKNLNESPSCTCGGESEDLNHIFWACPRFAVQRSKLIRSLISKKIYPPHNIESLIDKPYTRTITPLISFLHSCNLEI